MITLAELPLRIVPTTIRRARRPQRLLERHWVVNRSGEWLIVFTGIFEPLFYLLSIRIGFGALIGDVVDGTRSVPYAVFVAPALMASSAMNGSVFEATNVFFRLKYDHVYQPILATPMTAGDVALGEVGYATIRGTIYSLFFLLAIVGLGMAESAWIVLALPICTLLAFSFSAVAIAGTTFMRSITDFEYAPSIMLPLFLFSATFYPASSYGSYAWVLQLSPFYHGVALVRSASYGAFSWASLGHVAVLVALALVGLGIVARRIDSLLLK